MDTIEFLESTQPARVARYKRTEARTRDDLAYCASRAADFQQLYLELACAEGVLPYCTVETLDGGRVVVSSRNPTPGQPPRIDVFHTLPEALAMILRRWW